MMNKQELFEIGKARIIKFCKINKMKPPNVDAVHSSVWKFPATCAYWRDDTITICVEKCANAATERQFRNWSWPGNTVDRTPCGVLAHELGHHFDYHLSNKHSQNRYFGDFGKEIRRLSGDKPLSGYCPNDAEWFAEMFRLYVTNPDLLRNIRQRTYYLLTAKINTTDEYNWKDVLKNAPERIIRACENKIP